MSAAGGPVPPAARTWRTADPAATRALARRLAAAIRPSAARGVLLSLHGDLGSGKTVFVQGLAEGLGIPPSARVVSPTFTIARSYPVPGGWPGAERPPGLVLHHVDAYRLRDLADLEAAGFEEMWGDRRVTCVEWGERVDAGLPADRLEVSIAMEPPAEETLPGEVPRAPRRIRIAATGPLSRAILDRFAAASGGSADPGEVDPGEGVP